MFKTKEEALNNISRLKFSKKEFNLFRNDKEVVLEAIKQDGYALEFASDKLKDDKNVVLEAVKKDGWALQFAPDEIKNDKEVVLAAVRQDGWALQFASDEITNDKEVVLEAVKQDGLALSLASKRLQNDKDVLNSMRDFLLSSDCPKGELFLNSKENLLQYDREDREKELLSKLAELNKLQAQQNSNQAKVEVRTKRKL